MAASPPVLTMVSALKRRILFWDQQVNAPLSPEAAEKLHADILYLFMAMGELAPRSASPTVGGEVPKATGPVQTGGEALSAEEMAELTGMRPKNWAPGAQR